MVACTPTVEDADMAAPLTPARIEALAAVARDAAAAAHGHKQAVYERACAELGCSLATLHRQLAQVAVRPERKRRADAGGFALPLDEAKTISAYLVEHYRGNGKRGITLAKALENLRANGLVRAEALDADTGEIKPLSVSAVLRALRGYGLHWRQLRAPSLAVPQSTPHPNHTWQMDASVCTLFYLDDGGTQPMPEQVFYKNKPENFERVARQRVTRFLITDHTSGAIRLRYFLGSESVANYAEFFIWAIQQQPGLRDPMHGVPFQLSIDPGSGMQGAFKNLARRLQVRLIVNAPGNPRAKGSVESAQNLVEMGFEHQFRSHRPASLAELNERAQVWAAHFNATAVHSRHGQTRAQKWLEITPEQLRTAPSVALCRELLTADVKPCTVDAYGHVQFGGGGRRWDVRGLPGGVHMGEKVNITYNAYNDREVFAVYADAQGNEVLHPCPLVERDAHGFMADAREIGSGYRALPDTAADAARKQADLLATGAHTLEQAQRTRKAKGFEVFGGQVRFEHLKAELEAAAPMLPRRGQALELATTTPGAPAPARLLTHFEAARALHERGVPMSAELVGSLKALHADGVPEDELDALAARLTVRAGLRVVAGGGGA